MWGTFTPLIKAAYGGITEQQVDRLVFMGTTPPFMFLDRDQHQVME